MSIKILIAPAFLLLGACATTVTDVERATSLCGLNGGVKQINAKYNSTVRITCENGASFKYRSNIQ